MPRVREMNMTIGDFQTGAGNAITDVPGIRVGHTTIENANTGVTAIVPDSLPIPAAVFSGNGYGKLIGSTQIDELGEIETPILLTSTLSAFRAADALVSWMLQQPGHEQTRSLNPVVGETNDGRLSDIRARLITEQHVFNALNTASAGAVGEGCIGAGSGTVALGFKGGIGTSSRVVNEHMVGAIVQSNFGGTLRVQGQSIPAPVESEADHGSCMIVVATDAPLDARQLGRIAKRAVFAMDRVGASFGHGSGDYGIAINTRTGERIRDADLNQFFSATMDAVEEALLNSLFMAETTTGVDGTVIHSVWSHMQQANITLAGNM